MNAKEASDNTVKDIHYPGWEAPSAVEWLSGMFGQPVSGYARKIADLHQIRRVHLSLMSLAEYHDQSLEDIPEDWYQGCAQHVHGERLTVEH